MKKRIYTPFSKIDEQPDGTVVVIGIASTEALDSQGEVVKADAMVAALPDFFKYGTGNLREMHQPLAAGTVDKADITDGVTTIEVTVVDPVAVKKVLAGVYKGFSIGGAVTARDKVNKTVITGMRLTEISLVDRPANPEAVFEAFKADGIESESELNDSTTEETAALEIVEKSDAPVVENADIDALAAMLDKGDVTPAQLIAIGENVALNKGMYTISSMAELLNSIKWLAQDTAWEAEYEADASTIPAQLRAWLNDGLKIFGELVTEEVAELAAEVAQDEPEAEVEVVELAEKTTDMVKFDGSTETIIKGLGLTADSALADVVNKMASRIVQLEAMPTVGKAFLNAVAITKSQDNGDILGESAKTIEPVKKADGNVDDVATMIKAIHGGRS